MNAMVTKPTPPSRQEFVERIKSVWHRSRESILAMGRALIDAKDALPHGEFTAMIYEDLPFGPDTARRFMRIANDPRFSNHETSHALPDSADTMDHLRKLPPDRFERLVETGVINARMTEREAEALVPRTRPLLHVESRPEEELKSPITGYAELLGALKGYRTKLGLSQLALDEKGGLPDGYTGKLEVDLRRAVGFGFWTWLGALRLSIILVPIADALRADTCPCCGTKKV